MTVREVTPTYVATAFVEIIELANRTDPMQLSVSVVGPVSQCNVKTHDRIASKQRTAATRVFHPDGNRIGRSIIKVVPFNRESRHRRHRLGATGQTTSAVPPPGEKLQQGAIGL